jgi:hypothetical protein
MPTIKLAATLAELTPKILQLLLGIIACPHIIFRPGGIGEDGGGSGPAPSPPQWGAGLFPPPSGASDQVDSFSLSSGAVTVVLALRRR